MDIDERDVSRHMVSTNTQAVYMVPILMYIDIIWTFTCTHIRAHTHIHTHTHVYSLLMPSGVTWSTMTHATERPSRHVTVTMQPVRGN